MAGSGQRRIGMAVVLAALTILASAMPAAGWAGGRLRYGTHNWLIDASLRVLDGRVDDWFNPSIAQSAVDEPDTVEREASSSTGEHVYRDRGRRGGAVDRISREYDAAQAAYQEGAAARAVGDDTAARTAFDEASYHLGLLAHFVGDISQPYHSAYGAISEPEMHLAYERLVNLLQPSPTSTPAWQSRSRRVSEITNIRATAVATAAFSRPYWRELHELLVESGATLTPRVAEITGLVLKRATDDLADIIWSVSRGVGAAPAVGKVTVSVRWTGVASGGSQAVYVQARDVNGDAIEGLRVTVAWPTATGVRTEWLYTDGSGNQVRSGYASTSPRLRWLPAVATTTVRGETRRAEAGWTISPRLGSGSAGFKVRVATATAMPGQTVQATAVARTAAGTPVRNLKVSFAWRIGTRTIRTSALTDSTGWARSTYLVTTATPPGSYSVVASTQSGSRNRSASTTFTQVVNEPIEVP